MSECDVIVVGGGHAGCEAALAASRMAPALVQLDPASVSSPTMEKVLGTFKRIKGYTDKNAAGRDWNLATAMIIKGEAGMQIMGDWAKGEFLAAGKAPGKDFVCAATPGSANALLCSLPSSAT